MYLYHLTTFKKARVILAKGFEDASGSYPSGQPWSGVWLSDDLWPLHAEGEAVLMVEMPEGAVLPYEWTPMPDRDGDEWLLSTSREFLVPAEVLNPYRHIVELLWEGEDRPDRGTCFNCRFLLRFTPLEAKTYSARLAARGLAGDFFGACTYRSATRSLVIRRYLDHPVDDCRYWQEGYFHDSVGASCPQCREGAVVVVRPAKERQTYTLIGCSRYPDCKFMSRYFPLDTPCRFCGVPLVLGAGERLICYCPECKRNAVIPLTLSSWPHLFKRGDTCPHNLRWDKCDTCNRSRAEKRNVVDLEVPAVVQYELKLRERLSRAEQRAWEIVDGYEACWREYYQYFQSDVYEPWEGEWETNLLDQPYTCSVRWDRSAEEGWFYEDY